MKLNHAAVRAWLIASILLAVGMVTRAQAIDNPDAPDYVAQFEKRAKLYEQRISDLGGGGSELRKANVEYQRFLEAELQRSYQMLSSRLDAEQAKELANAQKRWLLFRTAEFAFLDGNWTEERFGTSSYLSRAEYRATVTKNRILLLLYYLKNYK